MPTRRCGAPTRAGTPCRRPVADGTICPLHDPGVSLQPERERDARRATVLEVLARTGSVVDACAAAEIHTRSYHRWKATDAEFAREVEEALDVSGAALEREARRRAVDGVERSRVTRDGVIVTERVYSDRLLELLLRAHVPERFGADFNRREEATQRREIFGRLVDEFRDGIEDLIAALGLDPNDPATMETVKRHMAKLRRGSSINSVETTRGLAEG